MPIRIRNVCFLALILAFVALSGVHAAESRSAVVSNQTARIGLPDPQPPFLPVEGERQDATLRVLQVQNKDQSGLRPSLRPSQQANINRFSHNVWHKNREGINTIRTDRHSLV